MQVDLSQGTVKEGEETQRETHLWFTKFKLYTEIAIQTSPLEPSVSLTCEVFQSEFYSLLNLLPKLSEIKLNWPWHEGTWTCPHTPLILHVRWIDSPFMSTQFPLTVTDYIYKSTYDSSDRSAPLFRRQTGDYIGNVGANDRTGWFITVQ